MQIACLRSLKLPARYVSGYLRTYPPPAGARAFDRGRCRAWVSVYCPGLGWLDVEPTRSGVVGEPCDPRVGPGSLGMWVCGPWCDRLGGRDHDWDVGVDVGEPLE